MRHALMSMTGFCVAAALGAASCSTACSASGAVWQTPVEIATGGGMRGPWQQNESKYDHVDDPTVALMTDGAAAVAWVDHRHKDVLFQIFTRTGAPRFTASVNVSRTPAVFSWLPRVVLSPRDPREIYVLWQEIVFSGGSHGGDIWFARSGDGGQTFSAPLDLSHSIGGDGKGRITATVWHNGSFDLAVAPDGGLHAAWTEYDGALWFSQSGNDGRAFTTPAQIAGTAIEPARAPSLAIDAAGNRYLAWTVGETPAADVHVAVARESGARFEAPVIVARSAGYSDAPKLAVDGAGTLHLAYAESDGGPFGRYHVRYTRSRDAGRTFEPSRVVSEGGGRESHAFPALAIDGRDRVFVLCEVAAGAGERSRELALVYSLDRGRSFTRPDRVEGSRDPAGGWNGSHQGQLMRKLAANGNGRIAVVNSALVPDVASRVWMMRGELRQR